MITLNLKWFVGLSVAAHAAVLAGWQSPRISPGSSGHTVQLSVVQQAGAAYSRPVETTDTDQPRQEKHEPFPDAGNPATRGAVVPLQPRQPAPTARHIQAQPRVATAVPATTSIATEASSPAPKETEINRHLRDSVMKLIAQQLTYPAIARRKGWQGVVRLELHIEADGSISALQLDKTSGYTVLDQAALQCLQTASIPDAGLWLQGRSIDMVVPVEYRLVDG